MLLTGVSGGRNARKNGGHARFPVGQRECVDWRCSGGCRQSCVSTDMHVAEISICCLAIL